MECLIATRPNLGPGDHSRFASAPHVGERTEKELITAFVNKIDELKPQLVLWLRHELFRGGLDQAKYDESELRLNSFLKTRRSKVDLSAPSETLLVAIPSSFVPGEGGSHG